MRRPGGDRRSLRVVASGNARVTQVAGDLHIHNPQYNEYRLQPPPYRIDPLPVAAPVAPQWLRRAPSRLLDARAELVPFTGREDELQDLGKWRESPHECLSVRLVHGVGGQGKTRLAHRFAAQSAAAGWSVLTARYGAAAPVTAPSEVVPPDLTADSRGEESGILLLVDYADRWPHTELVRLFSDPVLQEGRPARVLLIGRSVQWWPAVRGELAEMHAEADERQLTSLCATAADRIELFTIAHDRFAALLDAAPPGASTPRSPQSTHAATPAEGATSGSPQAPTAAPAPLTGPGGSAYDTVLTVHMAALVAAYGGHLGASFPDRPEALAAYLLDREHMTWRRLFDAGTSLRTRPRELARVVFAATLTGALSQRAGLAVLDTAGLVPAQELLDDHRLCYPPFDAGTVLEPLYPDRLAEDFLALSLPGHGVEGYDPDPWAPDALSALLGRDDGGLAPAYTARSVTFLAAAALRWPHVAAVVNGLLHRDPGLAVDAGSAGLTAVADVPDLDIDVLDAVVARFPDSQQTDLDAGMASVVSRRARDLLGAAQGEPDRLAVSLDPEMPFRLLNAGRFIEAVDALQESIPWWRRLARAENKDGENARFLGDALSMLSAALLRCGRIPEAVKAGRESVKVYRRSAVDGVTLGQALVNYSNALFAAELLPAALDAATEAVRLYRSAPVRDDHASATLANTLAHQSRMLADVGQVGPALEAADTALVLLRALADARPAAWQPSLAAALNGAALLWAKTGQRQQALDASLESVAIYRQVVEANPAAYQQEIAGVLTNLGRDLAAVGRHAEALDAAREAVALRRGLADRDPLGHQPALAQALDNLCSRLEHAGRRQEALDTAREAVTLLRPLAQATPVVHDSKLATALITLGSHLRRCGQPAQALPIVREGVRIRRNLAATGTATHQEKLASGLDRLARVCADAGRPAEGIEAATEAVAGYLALIGDQPGVHRSTSPDENPDVHKPAFANAYMTLSRCLSAADRPGEALRACEQSVYLLLALARTDPPRFEPDLAAAFSNLSGALRAVGRHAEAGGIAQNTVLLYRRLAAQDPARWNRRLATAHYNLGLALSEGADPRHLVSAAMEAVKDLRRLTDTDPAFAPDLAMALSKLSVALAGAGQWHEVLVHAEEAMDLRKQLAAADPATHEPHLARLLYGLAATLLVGGVAIPRATAMARESLIIHRRLARRDPATFEAESQKAAAALTRLLQPYGVGL
ncbi:tetratricopeptide repeat protein [Streptomyces caelestis]|uniref:Tetratricopeptide repeat protein n=1 Tax=Streptomyces heliomycini TaxID=284032 RepID=A0ABV5LCA8_9ACTN